MVLQQQAEVAGPYLPIQTRRSGISIASHPQSYLSGGCIMKNTV
jgi:hypothetical protein